jgi:hypothetical protein
VTDNGDDTYTLTFTATDTVTPLPYDYSTDLATLQDQFARGGATLLLCDDKLLDRGLAAFDGVDTITTTAPLVPAVGNWLVLADLGDVPVAATRFGFLGRDKWGI